MQRPASVLNQLDFNKKSSVEETVDNDNFSTTAKSRYSFGSTSRRGSSSFNITRRCCKERKIVVEPEQQIRHKRVLTNVMPLELIKKIRNSELPSMGSKFEAKGAEVLLDDGNKKKIKLRKLKLIKP